MRLVVAAVADGWASLGAVSSVRLTGFAGVVVVWLSR